MHRAFLVLVLVSLVALVRAGDGNGYDNFMYLEDKHEYGAFRVASMFDDHMVLQREPEQAKIWGWCNSFDISCVVTLRFQGKPIYAQTLARQVMPDGLIEQTKWEASLPSQPAGGPFQIHINDSNSTAILLDDILFGDVFHCVGQSNMLFNVAQTFSERQKEDSDFDFPDIRVTTVQRFDSYVPLEDYPAPLEQKWVAATEDSILDSDNEGPVYWSKFSAVCWYFGVELYRDLQIPIGLVASAVNGSPLHTWVPESVTDECGGLGSPSIESCCPYEDNITWNGVVFPSVRLVIKGVIFYQGESNMYGPSWYACGFPLFVDAWRQKAGNEFLPFFTVELAPVFYNYDFTPDFRALQMDFTQEIPDVHISTCMEFGDYYSPFGFLHPRKKEVLGQRIFKSVSAAVYASGTQSLGPRFSSLDIDSIGSDRIGVTVWFDEDTISDGLLLVHAECPETDDYRLETHEMDEFCGAFEVVLEDGTHVPIEDSDLLIQNGNSLYFEASFLPHNPIRKVNYAYKSWPRPILYNSDLLPATQFSFTLDQ